MSMAPVAVSVDGVYRLASNQMRRDSQAAMRLAADANQEAKQRFAIVSSKSANVNIIA